MNLINGIPHLESKLTREKFRQEKPVRKDKKSSPPSVQPGDSKLGQKLDTTA